MPHQSVRRSSSRSTGWRGMPIQISSIMTGVRATFSQKSHCQFPLSDQSASSEPPMFCEKTKRKE